MKQRLKILVAPLATLVLSGSLAVHSLLVPLAAGAQAPPGPPPAPVGSPVLDVDAGTFDPATAASRRAGDKLLPPGAPTTRLPIARARLIR